MKFLHSSWNNKIQNHSFQLLGSTSLWRSFCMSLGLMIPSSMPLSISFTPSLLLQTIKNKVNICSIYSQDYWSLLNLALSRMLFIYRPNIKWWLWCVNDKYQCQYSYQLVIQSFCEWNQLKHSRTSKCWLCRKLELTITAWIRIYFLSSKSWTSKTKSCNNHPLMIRGTYGIYWLIGSAQRIKLKRAMSNRRFSSWCSRFDTPMNATAQIKSLLRYSTPSVTLTYLLGGLNLR